MGSGSPDIFLLDDNNPKNNLLGMKKFWTQINTAFLFGCRKDPKIILDRLSSIMSGECLHDSEKKGTTSGEDKKLILFHKNLIFTLLFNHILMVLVVTACGSKLYERLAKGRRATGWPSYYTIS